MNLLKMLKALLISAPCVSPAECVQRVRAGAALLIDVREPGEWTGGFAHSAALLPLSDLTGARTHWNLFLTDTASCELLLYCASGGRSGMAAHILVAKGVRAASSGGFADWLEAGWPVARPAKTPARAR